MDKKLFSFITVFVVTVAILAVAFLDLPMALPKESASEDIVSEYDKETVYLWYTDDALTNYLKGAATTYNEKYGTRIVPELKDGVGFFEQINSASIEKDAPDLFITTNDQLSKAYLAGLSCPIEYSDESAFKDAYLSVAYNAVTYEDMYLAYPLYFEVATLLYNEDYLEQMAVSTIDREIAQAIEEGLIEPSPTPVVTPSPVPTATPTPTAVPTASPTPDPQATPTPLVTPSPSPLPTASPTPTPLPYEQEVIDEKVLEIMPETISQLNELADGFDAPEQVQTIFTWDVNDILYNYFFVGDAINLGGEAGWDKNSIDIYNLDAITALNAYQSLNKFYSIDTSLSDYQQVISDFIEGKIVFTIATSDAVATLENAVADGTMQYDYGFFVIPDMSEELWTRSLSITDCVAVNPYSKHKDVANDFAFFMTTEYSDILYSRAGKIPTCKNVEYENGALAVFAEEYEYSISMPKIMELSNFWVQLEAALATIWDDASPNDTLKKLAEQMNYQLTGNVEILDYIEEPVVETEEEEYFDEEVEE